MCRRSDEQYFIFNCYCFPFFYIEQVNRVHFPPNSNKCFPSSHTFHCVFFFHFQNVDRMISVEA